MFFLLSTFIDNLQVNQLSPLMTITLNTGGVGPVALGGKSQEVTSPKVNEIAVKQQIEKTPIKMSPSKFLVNDVKEAKKVSSNFFYLNIL